MEARIQALLGRRWGDADQRGGLLLAGSSCLTTICEPTARTHAPFPAQRPGPEHVAAGEPRWKAVGVFFRGRPA